MARRIDEFFTPESLVDAQKLLEEELERENDSNADPNRSRTLPSQLRHKNGHWVWLESSLTFIRDASMKPVGVLGVTRDITERKNFGRADQASGDARSINGSAQFAIGQRSHVRGNEYGSPL